MPSPSSPRAILFTSFEPSGDALAAAVTCELRQRADIPVHALGGPNLQAAGANVIEQTTGNAVMLAGAVAQAWTHRQRLVRLRHWLNDHPLGVLVPVDSPAANWSVCKLIRRHQPRARIVHLVAPQLWAWASWRIRRLRRLTDHVLALLPFEEQWFGQRGVKTTFIGHPLFDTPAIKQRRVAAEQSRTDLFPQQTSLRIALLPGSRAGEIHGNLPTMLRALDQVAQAHPNLIAVAGAVDRQAAQRIRDAAQQSGLQSTLDARVTILENMTDAVIAWADVVLAASGTVILQVAAHRKPVVAIYNVNRLSWNLAGRWLVNTRTFTLPNLIAESLGIDKPVIEIIPHFHNVDRVAGEVRNLVENESGRQRQIDLFDQVISAFNDTNFAQRAADILLAEGGWVNDASASST